MENKIVTNRKTPPNEAQYVAAYIKLNPSANNPNDGLDISAVKTKDGTAGYALLPESINRSKDREPHRGKAFISTEDLKKAMK